MPAAYFDSSVLVKTYVRETASSTALRLVRQRQIITSSITGLELTSAFRRNLTSGSLDKKAYTAILKRFQQQRKRWREVELTPDALVYAEKYVYEFDVRALDAIHIASAIMISGRFSKELPFITADSRQGHVAEHLGLQVTWVT